MAGGAEPATTPRIWRQLFEIIPSPYFGLNYDPSHFVWQQIDYLRPLYEFKERIFHVHFKDIKLYADKLNDVGIMAYPLEYMSPKLPGLGDVDWGKYVSALTDIGYDSWTCIEVEYRAFEGSRRNSQQLPHFQEIMEQSLFNTRNKPTDRAPASRLFLFGRKAHCAASGNLPLAGEVPSGRVNPPFNNQSIA
jgi:sugar phosphate isomerase/epimerase